MGSQQLPGRSCVERLLQACEKIERGEYVLPLGGLLRVESDVLQASIPLELVVNIERVGKSEDIPMAKLTLLVRPEVPWDVKFGKDGRGKFVFTNPKLDE